MSEWSPRRSLLLGSIMGLVFGSVNLNELTTRPDWRNLMLRFSASDAGSLRSFINLEYVKVVPLKLAVCCAIGVVMGALGGSLAQLLQPRHRTA